MAPYEVPMSAHEVADLSGLSVNTINRALRAGELTGVQKDNRQWLILRSDALEWMRMRRRHVCRQCGHIEGDPVITQTPTE